MRIGKRQRREKVKVCSQRTRGSCGTFGNEREGSTEEASLGHGIPSPGRRRGALSVLFLCSVIEEEEDTASAQSSPHQHEAVTSPHLAISRSSSSIGIVRFRLRRRPLALTTQHRTSRPSHTSAPPFSGEAHTTVSTPRSKGPRRRPTAPVCPVLRACVRACVRA